MKKSNRAVELCKDVLIVLLSCSALWLAARTPLAAPLWNLFQEERPQVLPGQNLGGERGAGALPLAMAVNLPGDAGLTENPGLPEGGGGARYGVRYDQSACQELFQRVAGPLAEALSGAGTPEAVGRSRWERALTGELSVYMDFQGQIPLPVLAGWMSGESTSLTADLRRLILAVGTEGVELYYRDESDGRTYRCLCEAADPDGLYQALSGLTENGAFFAFEQEEYAGLDPDTLLLPDAPSPAIYTVTNPMSAGRPALESLVQDLGFSNNSTSFYSTDEQVARSGDDSVRLSDRGTAQYLYEGKGESGLFPVLRQGEAGPLFDSVETCRQLALSAMGSRCGEARLYLLSVREREGETEISFGYSLNGVPVLLEQGRGACFLVRDGQIVQFSVELRSYTASGTSSLVLPPRQAAAAQLAGGLEGEELLLTYSDTGGDVLAAGWSARDGRED